MPIMLLCSFIVASTGLAALVLAGVTLPRHMSRAGAACFLLALAAWLLSFDLGISVFSWQVGISLHRAFKTLTVIAHRAAWTLVPLAACALSAPRTGEKGKTGMNALLAVSIALTAFTGAVSLSMIPALTRAAHAHESAVWVAACAFISLACVAVPFLDRERIAREGRSALFLLAAAFSAVLAGMPTVFRLLSLDENVVILVVSLALSVAIFVSSSLAPRVDATRKETPRKDDEPPSHPAAHQNADGIFARLSSRETEIANLLAEGKTNGEIAEALFISLKTVETHIYNIFRKTGVSNRVQLARALLSRSQG
jgi:DNA-binding CsgD family transcriptional regulator